MPSNKRQEEMAEALRGLRVADANARAIALDRLMGVLVPEDRVNKLTPEGASELVALVKDPSVPDRYRLVDLLIRIVLLPDFWDRIVGGLDLSDAAVARTRGKNAVGQSYRAVLAGFDVYLALLEDPEPLVRSAAALLVAYFSKEADRARDPIRVTIDRETDEDALGLEAVALGLVGRHRHSDDDVPRLEALLTHSSTRVRAGAGIGLFHAQRDGISDASLTAIAAALREAHVTGHAWPGGSLARLAPRILGALGSRGRAVASDVLVPIARADGPVAPPLPGGGFDATGYHATMEVLRLWFPARQAWLRLEELDDGQRRILDALSGSDVQGDFRAFGLPMQAEYRRKLLSGEWKP